MNQWRGIFQNRGQTVRHKENSKPSNIKKPFIVAFEWHSILEEFSFTKPCKMERRVRFGKNIRIVFLAINRSSWTKNRNHDFSVHIYHRHLLKFFIISSYPSEWISWPKATPTNNLIGIVLSLSVLYFGIDHFLEDMRQSICYRHFI